MKDIKEKYSDVRDWKKEFGFLRLIRPGHTLPLLEDEDEDGSEKNFIYFSRPYPRPKK